MSRNIVESNSFWLSLLILTNVILPTEQKRDYYFTINSCEVDSSFSKICQTNCTLTKKGEYNGMTAYINLLSDNESSEMNFEFFARGLNGGHLPTKLPTVLWSGFSIGKANEKGYITLLNTTVPNLCTYLKGGGTQRKGFVEITFDEMMKHSKLPGCPAKQGIYYINNFLLSTEYFPPILPESEFLFKGMYFGVKNGERHECMRYSISGSVRNKKRSF